MSVFSVVKHLMSYFLCVISIVFITTFSYASDSYYSDAQTSYAKGDFSQAFEGFQRLSKEGDARADFQLGVMYLYGRGIKEDSAIAANYFERAAEKGNEGAILVLGRMYLEGSGVTKDIDKAIKIYENGASQNMPVFGYLLGNLYLDTSFPKADDKKAVEWLNKAAEENSPEALYALGQFYENTDAAKSSSYFSKAASLGYRQAAFKTKQVENYVSSSPDFSDSEEEVWMLRSAGEGNEKALSELAEVYAHLRYDTDYSWIRKSASPDNRIGMEIFDTTKENVDEKQNLAPILIVPFIFIFSMLIIILSYVDNKRKNDVSLNNDTENSKHDVLSEQIFKTQSGETKRSDLGASDTPVSPSGTNLATESDKKAFCGDERTEEISETIDSNKAETEQTYDKVKKVNKRHVEAGQSKPKKTNKSEAADKRVVSVDKGKKTTEKLSGVSDIITKHPVVDDLNAEDNAAETKASDTQVVKGKRNKKSASTDKKTTSVKRTGTKSTDKISKKKQKVRTDK